MVLIRKIYLRKHCIYIYIYICVCVCVCVCEVWRQVSKVHYKYGNFTRKICTYLQFWLLLSLSLWPSNSPISFTVFSVQTEAFPVRAAAQVTYLPDNGRRHPIWTGSSRFHCIPVPSWCNVHLDSQILSQGHNLQLQLEERDVTAKFIYRTKRNVRNLVVEVNCHTRKQILNTRMKIGWVICNVDNYIHVNRCFKCSRYNHRLPDCRGEETGRHKLRECRTSQNDFKCIDCMK
jgi:hypothetical protein